MEQTPNKKQRTSMVFDVDDYNYIKSLQLKWSYERGVKLSIESVLSEIVAIHRNYELKIVILETMESIEAVKSLIATRESKAFQDLISNLNLLKKILIENSETE